MNKIFEQIISIIFPIRCAGCGTKDVLLCKRCTKALGEARSNVFEEKDIFSLFDYRNEIVRKVIKVLKYEKRRITGRIGAEILKDELLAEVESRILFENFTKPLIIPIPISRKRERERGFNQSEVIARHLFEKLPTGEFEFAPRGLSKIRDTISQTKTKSRSERLKNIVGSFEVTHPKEVAGRNIIIIDDVWTTGGTIKEARETLKKAGAKKIIAFTLAH